MTHVEAGGAVEARRRPTVHARPSVVVQAGATRGGVGADLAERPAVAARAAARELIQSCHHSCVFTIPLLVYFTNISLQISSNTPSSKHSIFHQKHQPTITYNYIT